MNTITRILRPGSPRTGRARRQRATVAAAVTAVTALVGAACGTSSEAGPAPAAAAASSPAARGGTTDARVALSDRTGGLVEPGTVHVDPHADRARTRQVVHTAQLLYTFWNTGKTGYLDRAITGSFHDNTLPSGRPQGPSGPKAASQGFRAAVPDLKCELPDLYVTGDTFTARLLFKGHFTGTYNGVHGHGQSIDFNAIDIQHVAAGTRITEDWHLEDNLTFLQQAGLTVASAK
jgi:predicted ester cyclase